MAQNFGLSHITYLIIYFVGGGEAGLGLALLVHHEVGEVPLDSERPSGILPVWPEMRNVKCHFSEQRKLTLR